MTAMDLTQASVVVTGGAGFLGTHVVRTLRERGACRIAVPRSAEYDLTDAVATNRLFEETKPNLVIHLAARVGGIGANRKHPGTFFRDNVLMGVNVIEAARIHGVAKTVVAGTICAYPKFAPVPFKEDDLWNGFPEETNAAYGIAKKSLLVMSQAYRQEFGLNIVVVFPVNLYGPADNFDLEASHVIPAMIRKFVDANTRGEDVVTLWGDGTPTREFLYVSDAGEALVTAAERYDDGAPVNVGAGFEISMADLSIKIAAACNYKGRVQWDASRPNGQPRRMLDVTRAKERFGWSASISLDEGLQRTIAWYREHAFRHDARGAASLT